LMSPDGAFYTSQDADLIDGEHSAKYFRLDDDARRKLGVPRIDHHIYARENGWAINALAFLYQATGDAQYLDEAKRAAEWVVANRGDAEGGFRHGDSGGYLGDTLAMTRAFVSLYTSTGDRTWLNRARVSLGFIEKNFRNPDGAGFLTAMEPTDHAYQPHPERDENVILARVVNLVWHYTGDESIHQISIDAMRFPVTPAIAKQYTAAGVLLADSELTSPPVHLTIVGHKDAPESAELFKTALQFPAGYKRVEWWDKREGSLANADVEYPEMSRPAAFVCTAKSCSSPIFDPAKLLAKATSLN